MLRKLFLEIFDKRFYKFLLAGGAAAITNFFSRIVLSKVFIFAVAVVIAYIIGMILAFILNKMFVFDKSKHSTYKEFYYFTLVNIIGIIQTLVISVLLVKWLFPKMEIIKNSEEIAHSIGIIIPVISSFFGHKYISFKKAKHF